MTPVPICSCCLCSFLPLPSRCDQNGDVLPAPARRQQVVLVALYEGSAISTVTLVGQDEETKTARVVVEPGSAPLYLALSSSDPIIWRVEGEISRIERVVLLSYKAAGVVGLPAAIVVDLDGKEPGGEVARCTLGLASLPSEEPIDTSSIRSYEEVELIATCMGGSCKEMTEPQMSHRRSLVDPSARRSMG